MMPSIINTEIMLEMHRSRLQEAEQARRQRCAVSGKRRHQWLRRLRPTQLQQSHQSHRGR